LFAQSKRRRNLVFATPCVDAPTSLWETHSDVGPRSVVVPDGVVGRHGDVAPDSDVVGAELANARGVFVAGRGGPRVRRFLRLPSDESGGELQAGEAMKQSSMYGQEEL